MDGENGLSKVAENPIFVLCLYVFVITVWSLACNIDFISSNWKTVRVTRKRGRIHFLVIIFPLGYILFYLVVQSEYRDFKEVGAATVALCLALLHLLRTLWGLWQLYEFKRWAVFAIRSVQTLEIPLNETGEGRKCQLLHVRDCICGRKDDPQKLADNILINDTIVNNRLFEGVVRCALRFLRSSKIQEISEENSTLTQVWSYLKHSLLSFFCLFKVLIFVLTERIEENRGRFDPFLDPYGREESWLKWSTVLISDAIPNFLDSFRIDETRSSNTSPFVTMREKFAKEMLLSAAIHVQNTSKSNNPRKMYHAFLPYEELMKYEKMRRGMFSKSEFLRKAVLSGDGLPYNVAHDIKMVKSKKCYNYKKFDQKLKRVLDSLGADRYSKVEKLTISEIEWLEIFLSLKTWEVCSSDQNENCNIRETSTSESHYPIINLALQLGFVEKDGPKRVAEYFKFPLLKHARDSILWENRNVLECSVHIDNWIALMSGLSILNMMKHSDDEFQFSWDYERNKKLSFGMYDFHQLSMDSKHNRCDQTLIFLGCSMESLRSCLASWVLKNEGKQEDYWKPELTDYPFRFDVEPSDDFKECCKSLKDEKDFKSIAFRLRLLWELQNIFMNQVSGSNLGPQDPATYAMCILSFPAISIQLLPNSNRSGDVPVFHNSSSSETEFSVEVKAEGLPRSCALHVSYKDEKMCVKMNRSEEYNVFVWEEWRNAFQGRLAGLREWQWQNGCWSGMSGVENSNNSSENISSHIETGDRFLRCKYSISDGMEKINLSCRASLNPYRWGKECLTVWKGWLPHRRNMCKFELESSGLIKKHEVRNYMKASRIKINGETITIYKLHDRYLTELYEKCDRNCLQRCTVIVSAAIYDLTLGKVVNVGSPYSLGDTLEEMADQLARSDNLNFTTWITMYETAALYYDNFEALKSAVRMLTENMKYQQASKLVDLYFYSKSEELFTDQFIFDLISSSPWLDNLLTMFDRIISHADYSIDVVERYAKCFLNLARVGKTNCIGKAKRALQKAFLRVSDSKLKGRFLFCIKLYCDLLFESKTIEGSNLGKMIYSKIHELAKSIIDDTSPARSGRKLTKLLKYLESRLISDCENEEDEEDEEGEQGNYEDKLNLWFSLAMFFEQNKGYSELVAQLYEKAAEKGHVVSSHNYARMLQNGLNGLPEDAVRAKEYYLKAMEKGNVNAAFSLARLIQLGGKGLRPQPSESIQYFVIAMEMGLRKAAYNLANLYYVGADDVPKNKKEAVRILRQASDAGSTRSTLLLAKILLEFDDKTVFDPASAKLILEKLFQSMRENYLIKDTASIEQKFTEANLLLSKYSGTESQTYEASAILWGIQQHLDNVEKKFSERRGLRTTASRE